MYKVSVPVYLANLDRNGKEQTLEELKKIDAERVFFALSDGYCTDKDKRREMLALLRENCVFFRRHGFEVGAWFWGLMFDKETEFTPLQGVCGTKAPTFACPLDNNFLNFVGEYIKDIARTGVDIVMFDDDFSFYHSGSMDCLCDLHVKEINAITGEDLDRETLAEYIWKHPKNKYRDALIAVNGKALEGFAAAARKAADEINPDIRMGACAGLASFDIDGTTPARLAKIFAGKTKPFARLLGAPYWATHYPWIAPHTFGTFLQDAIEYTRMESAWIKSEQIELMAEGDVYPRPRSVCPAALLEGFDTALRAAGCTDGILKYAIDYYSDVGYETGYVKFHCRNVPLYQEIEKRFVGKTACGVRVYEAMNKVADAAPCGRVNEETWFLDFFFSKAAKTLAYNTIPTVYEGEGVTAVAFDENARHLTARDFQKGLIIDIAAAEILFDKGVDIGIERFGESVSAGREERFLRDGNHICSVGGTRVWDLELKDGAEILSDTETEKGTLPVSYRYVNGEGQRFLVFNLNSRTEKCVFRHYARGRQLAENTQWLGGEKLPAYCYGHPSLYLLCKRGENSLSVGLWNFFEDIAIEPEIELSKAYSRIEFIGCRGELKRDKVILSDIPAFGFAGFEVFD